MAGLGTPDLSRDEVQQALARQMRLAPVPAKGGKSPSNPVFPTRETLTEFYATNGHRLAWCDDSGKLLPSTKTLLDALRRAGEHGLDPEDYALSRLDLLGAQIGKAPLDDAAVARLADFHWQQSLVQLLGHVRDAAGVTRVWSAAEGACAMPSLSIADLAVDFGKEA
jgi:hypothetical protein